MESGADSGAGGEGEAGGDFLRCFGRQIKLLREQGGLTQAQLGERVGYGEAQIAAVEQGRRIPKPELIDAVDRVLGGARCAGGAEGGGGDTAVVQEQLQRGQWRRLRRGRGRRYGRAGP